MNLKQLKEMLKGLLFTKQVESQPQPEKQMTLSDLIDSCTKLVCENKDIEFWLEHDKINVCSKSNKIVFRIGRTGVCGTVFEKKDKWFYYDLKIGVDTYSIVEGKNDYEKMKKLYVICLEKLDAANKARKAAREIAEQKRLNDNVKMINKFLKK